MTQRIRRMLLGLFAISVLSAFVLVWAFLRPLSVELAGPASDVSVQVFGLGTIEARIFSKLGFEVGAALVELHADHGDRVQEGDVLARLQRAEQRARVAKARAGVGSAEAARMKAEAAVGKARAVFVKKRQTNQRQQALVARHTISAEAAEEAQMDADVAAAELDVAIRDVQVAQAGLEDAMAQAELESALLAQHELRAPYDAVIVERHRELGTVLAPGEPVFTLVAPETVWALAYIDEARAGGIEVGQPAEIRLRSLPGDTFAGHVARIGIESDRVSEERRVYVACDRCPERFHLGEQAEVLITTAVLDEALLVPEIAVAGFDGTGGTVWSVEDGALHRRDVRFGHRTLAARLEIVAGLPDGARVVTALRPGLREGRSVRAAETTAR